MTHKRANRRNVNGVLLLDKPSGISSNQALQVVKRLFNARKAGHTGSLDPLATGLLVICLGEATKVSAYLLEADKRYRATCRLGVKTSTADAEGEVVERRAVEDYSVADIERILARFRGRIDQTPPMYSAVKYQGRRLYELARSGIEVARGTRSVTIHELMIVDRTEDTLTLHMRCSKGTYVRTLVEDIGEALGCGAHVTGLRRLSVTPYDDPDMISLDHLSELATQKPILLSRHLLPIDSALSAWPALNLNEACAFYLRSGQPVQVRGAPTSGKARLYDDRCVFFGLGHVLDDGRIAPERIIRKD